MAEGQLDWKRFVGILSMTAQDRRPRRGEVAVPTVGVSSYVCDCCGRKHVAIACIGDDGVEVNVTVPPEIAREVAAEILDAAQRVDPRAPANAN